MGTAVSFFKQTDRKLCWHMNCKRCVQENAMATKMNMMKLLQEIRGFSEMDRLQPTPKPSALYLMQLRMRPANRPKQRLEISFDLKDIATLPTPVKITHLAKAALK
jgi:hypothetical protein